MLRRSCFFQRFRENLIVRLQIRRDMVYCTSKSLHTRRLREEKEREASDMDDNFEQGYAVVVLELLQALKEKIALILAAGALTFPDYGALGVWTVLMFHMLRGHKLWQLLALIAINWFGYEGQQLLVGSFEIPVQAFAIGAFLPIALYNGEKGSGGLLLQIGS